MKYKALIFDLDGTLLSTFDDILFALNKTLEEFGYKVRYGKNDAVYLLGEGSLRLVEKALVNENCSVEQFEKVYRQYMKNYLAYQNVSSKPYPGVVETLKRLSKDYLLFVVSNKPQPMADDVIKHKLGEIKFDRICGHKEGTKTKPDPWQINQIKSDFKLKDSECLYIGDSRYDIQTARNANIDVCLLTYGYEEYTDDLISKSDYNINKFELLEEIL